MTDTNTQEPRSRIEGIEHLYVPLKINVKEIPDEDVLTVVALSAFRLDRHFIGLREKLEEQLRQGTHAEYELISVHKDSSDLPNRQPRIIPGLLLSLERVGERGFDISVYYLKDPFAQSATSLYQGIASILAPGPNSQAPT